LYYKLIAAFDAGNLVLARQLQQKAIDMIRLLENMAVLPPEKRICVTWDLTAVSFVRP
jgi:dihydrodipicolinate synthase/N-acetylneuraminate lyase